MGGAYYPDEDIVKNGRRITPKKHATPKQMRASDLITPEIEGYLSAVGVRNPFSFHVAKYLRNRTKRSRQMNSKSSWISKLPEMDRNRYIREIERSASMTFEEYLRYQFRKYDKPKEVQGLFHEGINLFIHQECIQNDLDRLQDVLNISEPITVLQVNVTGAMDERMTYHDYYSPDLIDLVYKWNAPSFERFPEYSFDGIDNTKV